MGRALIGAVAGAVAMFIIGFIFFATPLQRLAVGNLDDTRAAQVQQSLAANLAATGTYYVPDGSTAAQSTMYGRGPVAVVHYNMGGFAVADPGVMITGFIHMLIVSILLALWLYGVSKYVADPVERLKLLGLSVLAGTIFMRLGNPIWFHQDWTYAIYLFIADTLALAAAGAIILKVLPKSTAVIVPPTAAEET